MLRLDGGRWVILGTHAGNDVVRVEPFVETALELRPLWGEPAESVT